MSLGGFVSPRRRGGDEEPNPFALHPHIAVLLPLLGTNQLRRPLWFAILGTT